MNTIKILYFGITLFHLNVTEAQVRKSYHEVFLQKSEIVKFNSQSLSDTVERHKFQIFWREMQNCLVQNDIKGLQKLITFPLTSRGMLDSEPIIKYNSQSFLEPINQYFLQQIDCTINDEIFPDRFKRFVTETPISYGSKTIRVGDMEFKKDVGKWKLYLIYLNR
jgi:hypothetical protein